MKDTIAPLPPIAPATAIDLEEAVLGAILIDTNAINEVAGLLFPSVFYDIKHRIIYRNVKRLYENNEPIDILTVYESIKSTFDHKLVSHLYLIQLASKMSSSAHIEYHARIVLQKYIMREIVSGGHEMITLASNNENDCFRLISVIERKIDSIRQLAIKSSEGISNDEDTYSEEIINKVKRRNAGKPVGISTMVPAIDRFLAGYNLGELYIVAGRPGMGKTTFALISSWLTSETGTVVVFYSLEMPKNQLISKIVSLITSINYKDIKSGNLTNEQLHEVLAARKYIMNSNFVIDDTAKTIEDISESAQLYSEKKKARLFVVDYIQRVKTRSKMDMRIMITTITRELKSIAKDNYSAVIALSQLTRGVDNRPNKRPLLSDLKESSSIEEDADVVAFLYRQAYYDQQTGLNPSYEEMFHTEFIIGKGRDTGTATIHLFIEPVKMFIEQYSMDGKYQDAEIESFIEKEQITIDVEGFEIQDVPLPPEQKSLNV